jgi:hypothetical protein
MISQPKPTRIRATAAGIGKTFTSAFAGFDIAARANGWGKHGRVQCAASVASEPSTP